MTAAMAAAAMLAAGMVMMIMSVMGTSRIGIKIQRTGQKCLHRLVRITADTAIDDYAGLRQRHPGTATDAAANQRLHTDLAQQTRQSAVAAAVGIDHLLRHHLALGDLINLESSGVSKVLEDLTICIGYRKFHNVCSLSV